MRNFIVVLSVLVFLCSCSDDDGITQESLDAQFLRIKALSESEVCEDSSEWQFVAVGFKACGGPDGYIAYSTSINTDEFLALVKKYNEDRRTFVEQEGLFSNCLFESPPVGIKCENGMAVLVYNPCELLPEVGPCEALIPKYYFDKETQECKEFSWGGCDGVVPFDTLEECQACVNNTND